MGWMPSSQPEGSLVTTWLNIKCVSIRVLTETIGDLRTKGDIVLCRCSKEC